MALSISVVVSAVDRLTGPTSAMGKSLTGLEQRLRGAAVQTNAFTSKWQGAISASRAAGAAMTAAGAGIALALRSAYGEASAFQQSMRNTNSIAKLSEDQFAALSKAVMGIAADKRVLDTPKALAAGIYDIYSSGLVGEQALAALEIASKGAAAGMSDTATASRVLVAAMNAYGKKTGPEATHMMDVMFKTVERGVITFPELASQLGDVLGIAAQLGVPIETLGAGISTMTKQGIGAAESVTSLNRILMSFLNPSKEMTAALKASGVESGMVMLRTKGLGGAMEWLTQVTGGNQEQMGKMLGEIRAVRAGMALTGKGAAMFSEDLEGMGEAAGAAGAALEEQSKGPLFQQQKRMQGLATAATQYGATLVSMVSKVAPVITSLIQALTALGKTAAGPALTVAAVGLGAISLAAGPVLLFLNQGVALWNMLTAALGRNAAAATAAAAANKAAAVAAAGGDMGKYVGGVAGGTFGMTTAKQAASRAATTIGPEIAATGAKAGAGFVASLTGAVSAALPIALGAAVVAGIGYAAWNWATAGKRSGEALAKAVASGTLTDDSAVEAMKAKLSDIIAEIKASEDSAEVAGKELGKAVAKGIVDGQKAVGNLQDELRETIETRRQQLADAQGTFGEGSRQALEAENNLLNEQIRLQIAAIEASKDRIKNLSPSEITGGKGDEFARQIQEAQQAAARYTIRIEENAKALQELGIAEATTGAATAKATRETKEQAKASENAADAQERHADAARDTARSVADAAEQITDADEAIVDAEEAKREAVETGAERLQKSLERLTDAQERYADAVEAANKREQDAIEGVANARARADEALLTGQERAQERLRRAREKVFDLTATPEEKAALEAEKERTALATARAELAEAEAEAAAFTAQITKQGVQAPEPEREADRIAREGIEAIVEAETALADVRTANARAVADANKGIADAEKGVADAIRETQKALADATERLQDAYKARTEAVNDHARAVVDANKRMAKSYKDLADAQRAAGMPVRGFAQTTQAAVVAGQATARNAARVVGNLGASAIPAAVGGLGAGYAGAGVRPTGSAPGGGVGQRSVIQVHLAPGLEGRVVQKAANHAVRIGELQGASQVQAAY